MTTKRITSGLAALALLATPAVASAHRSGDDHGRHHGRDHHGKKAQVREVTGAATATIASFTDNELTITLANGKSYSGLVTDRTSLKCETAAPESTTAKSARRGADDNGDNHDTGDDRGGNRGDDDGDNHDTGDDRGGDRGDDDGANHDAGDDHGNNDNGNGNGACTTAALTAGTKVTHAKLVLKSDGATWKKIKLLK
jgi:hypothetical protein